MPWHAAMKRLPPLARAKAIEIANALLAQGYDEGKAIRIAVAKAKAWTAAHRGVADYAAVGDREADG